MKGCETAFHKPMAKYANTDYFVLVPRKYQALKDDLPMHYLNTQKKENGEFATLPDGYSYDVPLSLNAEICLSEFRNKEVEKRVVNQAPPAEVTELDDTLFNAQIEAKRGIVKIKKIKRLKSMSPPR